MNYYTGQTDENTHTVDNAQCVDIWVLIPESHWVNDFIMYLKKWELNFTGLNI